MQIPEPTADVLRRLMAEHGLTDEDVASMASVHVNTVRSWRSERGTTTFRLMPPRHLAILRHLLPMFLATRASMQKAAAKGKKKPASPRAVKEG